MTLRARYAGEPALALARRPGEGFVSRVFRSSAYVRKDGDFFLILRGDLRSPMTVNVEGEGQMDQLLAVGDSCGLVGTEIRSGGTAVQMNGVEVYKSRLGRASSFNPVPASGIARGASMVRLLYGVSPGAFDLVNHESFRRFTDSVVRPLAAGDVLGLHELGNYLPLLGLGPGFTPAGDDLIAGFAATYNHAAASDGARPIHLPRAALDGRTVPESAAILDYAQRGCVDEAMEELILAATGGQEEWFTRQLLGVASRGHTSGIDMTVGVLLCVAAMEEKHEPGALRKALENLAGSRTV